MKVHEFQAKGVLARFGVPVPRGEVAGSAPEARDAAGRLGVPVVVKAQVHAGGRGKAGGVRKAATPEAAGRAAADLLGSVLITAQTGPAGRPVRRVLVEEAVGAARELYLALAVDPARAAVVAIASAEGGVDVEGAFARTPERVFKEYAPAGSRLEEAQARKLAAALDLDGASAAKAAGIIMAMAEALEATDAALVEVNPLAVTGEGDLVALDVRMAFDDNALGRRPEILALRDLDEASPLEAEAARSNLSYVKLDGDIGCMVNGAGLAMATMDLILQAGGRPANFLDVGGGVTEDGVARAFRILASDPGVRSALVNIFGGIVRCDTVASGVVRAVRETASSLPVVMRLEGTNAEEGRAVLRASGLCFHPAEGMRDAAALAVSLAGAAPSRRGGRP
jgi:succinyl-CoA synthetase beta subunit